MKKLLCAKLKGYGKIFSLFLILILNIKIIDAKQIINNIQIIRKDVYDTENEKENHWYNKIVNALHFLTKERTIKRELFFKEGDEYNQNIIEETERHLRGFSFITDALIKAEPIEKDKVNIKVITYDAFSTAAGLNFSTTGFTDKTKFKLEEKNLLGTGNELKTNYIKNNQDKEWVFSYLNRNLLGNHENLDLELNLEDNKKQKYIGYGRPYFSIETEHEWGVSYNNIVETSDTYSGNKTENDFEIYYGSKIKGDLTYALRLTSGYRHNIYKSFEGKKTSDMGIFIKTEYIKYNYIKMKNIEKIDRTEDINLAPTITGNIFLNFLGDNEKSNTFNLSLDISNGYFLKKKILLKNNYGVSASFGAGTFYNSNFSLNSYLYYLFNQKNNLLFHFNSAFIMHYNDEENLLTLGSDNGLRGYPADTFKGNKKILINIEERYFSNIKFFNSVRLTGVAFFDAAAIGINDIEGIKSSAGIGIRFGVLKSAALNSINFYIAYPFNKKYVPKDKGNFIVYVSTKKAF